MILEALSNITDPIGFHLTLEDCLSTKLRRLVVQDKLEKVKLLSHESKVGFF
ncbi:hypothetical protein MKX03_032222 [Papaver bracteatum]|nr:hypothetical protein MKX03_032222 [Papaver bracteatum]